MKTIHLIISLMLITLITSCKAQKNDLKQKKMKTFDIVTFEKNKNKLNNYTFITKDSTIVEQDEWQFGYEEIIKPKNSYFHTFNKYYKNGKLKMVVIKFPNRFLKHLKEYDQQGTLIKETDYDKPFTFTFEDVLKFIKKRDIDMSGYYFEITRGTEVDNLFWGVTWEKADKTGLKHIGIDGVTGKIVQEIDKNYPEG